MRRAPLGKPPPSLPRTCRPSHADLGASRPPPPVPHTHKRLGQIVADLAADERLRVTETIEAHLREHGEGEAAQRWVSCQSVVCDDATTSAEPLGHPYRGSAPRPPRPAPPGAKASRPRGGKPPFETLLVAVAVLVIVANWLTR
jgi:hypothetical protein